MKKIFATLLAVILTATLCPLSVCADDAAARLEFYRLTDEQIARFEKNMAGTNYSVTQGELGTWMQGRANYIEDYAASNPNDAAEIFADLERVYTNYYLPLEAIIPDTDVYERSRILSHKYHYLRGRRAMGMDYEAELRATAERYFELQASCRSNAAMPLSVGLVLDYFDFLAADGRLDEIERCLSIQMFVEYPDYTSLEDMIGHAKALGITDEAIAHALPVFCTVDNMDDAMLPCIYRDGTWYYPVSEFREVLGYPNLKMDYEEIIDFLDAKHTLFWNYMQDINLTRDSAVITINGEEYTLEHPILAGQYLYAPADFLTDVLDKKIVEDTAHVQLIRYYTEKLLTEGEVVVHRFLPETDFLGYTEEQLMYATGLTAAIHIQNSQVTPEDTVYHRENIEEQVTLLRPVTGLPMSRFRGTLMMMYGSWGIIDPETAWGTGTLNAFRDMTTFPVNAYGESLGIFLLQNSYMLGYLTREESVEGQMEFARRIQRSYDSWQDFAEAYMSISPEYGGDRSYIADYLYRDGFLDIPWDLDLSKQEPELEPVSDVAPIPVDEPEAVSAETEIQPEPSAPAATDENPASPMLIIWMVGGILAIGLAAAIIFLLRLRR